MCQLPSRLNGRYSYVRSPYCEGDQHSDSGDQEELASSDLVDSKGETDGNEEGPDLETTVDHGLVVGASDTD